MIADGGIKYSGDLAKAIAAGADCAMIGSLLAGTDETPGEVFLYQGRSYKTYRGMGSVGAMARGSADRYFQQDIKDALKLVPEGIEGQVPYKGAGRRPCCTSSPAGLRAAMGYVGAQTISPSSTTRREFVRISGAGLRESHVHDVTITRESPNYPSRRLRRGIAPLADARADRLDVCALCLAHGRAHARCRARGGRSTRRSSLARRAAQCRAHQRAISPTSSNCR